MKYSGTLIAVKDMDKSKKFYHDILGLNVIADFGANVILDGGVFLQTLETWKDFIRKEQVYLSSNAYELYFEESNLDAFLEHLKSFQIYYVHEPLIHSWGQRVVRFYDPDKHIIEVAEEIETVVRRFIDGGLSVEETAIRMDVPIDYVKKYLGSNLPKQDQLQGTVINMELVAPCGMNCSLCIAYQFREKDLNKKGFHRSYCPGCIPRGKNCTHMGDVCELLGKGSVRFCFECNLYPCKRLKTLDKRYSTKYHMSMIENLYFIQNHGAEEFLKKEAEKWCCPECGETICCHNGLCLNCNLDTLLQNKKYRWNEE